MTSRPDDFPLMSPTPSAAAITPTDVVLATPTAASAGLAEMRSKFLTDFADGLVGRHHNSYQHRSRILRQLADRESDT